MRIGGGDAVTALAHAPKISAGGLIRLLAITLKKQAEESAFRAYTAECLRTISQNTAMTPGNSYVTASYMDIINPKPQDTRTCEEITDEIIKKCGLVVSK